MVQDSVLSWAVLVVLTYGAVIWFAIKAVSEKETYKREEEVFWTDRR